MKQKVAALMFAALVALVGFAVAVESALAQNAVPPIAREAAAMPAFASRLHPATTQATSKSPASARIQRRPASPRDPAFYENGPVNGTTDAWEINFGYVVSDSFPQEHTSTALTSGYGNSPAT